VLYEGENIFFADLFQVGCFSKAQEDMNAAKAAA
jgi:hypothetical protein